MMLVFLNRLRQSQLHNKLLLSNHFINRHLLFHTLSPLTQPSLHTRIAIFNNSHPINVRFFAAPVQVKKKVENDSKGPNLNEKITAPVIRLVTDEGHDVLSRREALDRAKRLQLDLVEVDRNAKPPVCKLMDYNKERYKQQVKVKERAKSSKANLKKGTVKEIRFTGQITPNDMQLKADTVRRLLEEGYRVKCAVTRKKKEDDLGKCLSRLLSLVEDITVVEFGPNVDVDQAQFILRHLKLGPPKRSGNKASKVASPSSAESAQLEATGESESVIAYEDGSESDEEDTQKIQPVFNKEELATLPANRYSQPSSRRPPIESPGIPASPPGIENRYRRDPRNYNAPVRPAMSNGSRVEAPPHNREVQHSGFGDNKFPRQDSPGSSFGNFGGPRSGSGHEQHNPAAGQANRYKKVSGGDQSRNSAAPDSKYSRGA